VTEKPSSGTCGIPLFAICSVLLGAGLLVYSQTLAFAWDEGFHLLAARLVSMGRRPYLDFVHAQAPLNAYWNALLLKIFGGTWRAIHAVDALLATTAVCLAAAFVRSRFTRVQIGLRNEVVDVSDVRVRGWGTACVLTVFVLTGLNIDYVVFGPIAQAYPFALLMIVSGFFLTVLSVEQDRALFAFLAGLVAGAGAESTLLVAPVVPVLLIWIAIYSSAEKRLARAAAFLAGVVGAFSLLLTLFVQSPRQVLFGVLQYHMFYRRSDWEGATQHDLELLTSWIRSPQTILLATLALAGVWFIAKKSGWEKARRAEFCLAGWIGLVLTLYLCMPHPTFVQYFLLPVPFFAILGAVGLFGIAHQFANGEGELRRVPTWPATAVAILMCLSLAREIYQDRDDYSWPRMEKVAQKVNEVTKPGAPAYLDEATYFLSGRTPPRGNEYLSSHKLNLPSEFAEFVHLVPQADYDRRIAAKEFETIETCEEEDWYQERGLESLYRRKAEVGDCTVFWDPRK
jgi:hypothetical protein